MGQEKLRSAIVRAYDLHHLSDSAISIAASLLVFRGFDYDDEPVASITSSHEFILDWHGHEMPMESAVDFMEKVGYIHPRDFGMW